MFVCVHDLEYVSDTGSLFICPGARQKDWENLPLVQPYQQSLVKAIPLAVSQWAGQWVAGEAPRRGWELMVRWCGWWGGVVGTQRSAGQMLHYFHCCMHCSVHVTGLKPSHLRGCALSLQKPPFHYQSWWSYSALSFLGMLLVGGIVTLFLVLFFP